MNITEIITLSIACIGALLGIINTYVSLRKDKVRLKITPMWVTDLFHTEIGIKIINLSQFPIVIENVGFTLSTKQSLYIMEYFLASGSLPQEIKSRDNIQINILLGTIAQEEFRKVRKAFVNTADGSIFYGKSSALKQMVTLKNLPKQIQEQLDNLKNN